MSVKKALDKFGKSVVKGAKKELSRQDKNASKKLSNSISYTSKESKNSFAFSISMEDYGKFVDRGVKGVGGTKADGSQWKKKKVTNNDFKYKPHPKPYKKGAKVVPPASAFSQWTVRRGIAPRSNKGQFTSRKGLQFAIARSVYHTGLKTTNFLTKPFEKAFKKLPDDITEAFGLQVDEFLKFSIK